MCVCEYVVLRVFCRILGLIYNYLIQYSLAYNEVGYCEQLHIVNTFRIFGWFAIELMLKNFGYSELRYSESLVNMIAF